ncbi:unnamed protein product [Rhizophagus irregularis]|uniref:RZ-type domain-containing protein n=1 Tax=Rhizophagus irregularis TaxID=588596 RepID=A0A915ZVL3_9GLOM|nr:unnamed protein product [Rhizophagus irregularis]
MLNEKIYKTPVLVNLLKTRTVNWLKEHSNNTNWQYEVSSNKKLLYPYSSFANALLAHIRRVIRKPIAKLLYALEKYAAIYTIIFLCEKSITNKVPVKFAMESVESSDTIKEISDDNIMSDDACLLEFWNKMVDDDNVISIEGLNVDPSPDSYVMPHGVYELEFPFSYYIMKKIDDSRRVYEEELLSLYNNQENIDKTTGELHTHVVEGYNKKFINNIEKSPIIKNSPIANYPEKYFKDFINVILSDKVSSGEKDGNLDEKLLKFIFERRLGADNVLNPIRLHSYWWKNSSSILAELSLAQMSPNVITQIETEKENEENKILLDVEFEIYLVEQVIRNLLSRIIDAKEGEHEGLRNLRIIERWQYEVTKVLSLCEKINVSFKLYSLQLLRICNDLLVTKSIPLGDMKRIIEYAQQQNANSSSDGAQNEIITEGFINIVMKILTSLELSENNLIPRRLFILRCLDMLTLESPVRLYLYRETFSSSPFPIMGAIISRIFGTEEKECPNSILHLIQQPKQILQHSERLATINECFNINNLNVLMAALICDTFQQEFFSKLDLVALVDGFNSAINALYGNDIQPLQRIASIAFLKEFTNQFWKCIIKCNEDYLQPITHNLLEAESFDGTLLMEQFNNTMSIPHPLITSFGLYLLRELRINREFSGDEIKKFCEAQSKNLNWFDNFNIDDKNESRLPFNPYWAVPSYGKLEIAFTLLYNDDNRPQFNSIFQQYNDKAPDLSDKLGLFGIVVAKLHSIRASREWKHNENQISQYFGQKITNLTTIPEDFKGILFNVLANTHPLLKINEVITNSELLIKSVIAHIIGLHVLLDPNTTPLSLYMHKIIDAQKTFILACQSDMENLLFNAIAEREGVSRYSCQCGYKYLIGECGGAMEESRCPECKKTIGGLSHVTAEGNIRLDVENKYSFESNDQKGYISEKINDDINYTMRYLTPVAYRILHLIVHAIIGSQAASPDSIALIQQHSKDYTNVEDYCMEHIKNDWNALKQILNCSDENLALTFHSLILTLDKNLPSCNSTLYSSYSRNQWETAFSQTTVLELTRNVNESAAKFRAQIEQNMKKVDVKNSLLEELINQTNLMDERYTRENLPSLWRVIELFSSSIRILGEIKSLIPQEEIPSEKLSLIIGQQSVPSYLTLSASLSTLTSKDNSSELLSLLEILLCFIKRTSIGDGNLLLNEFINQWVQLSSLTENSRFKTILSYELQLKHVVSLYEVIEEQVANIMIQFIDKKFKEPLTDDMKKDLDDAIDFEGGNKGKIPADSFIIAMKRFIQRVLQAESDKETHPLNTYVTDMSLSLWPSNNVIEEVLDDKFPDTLFVANSFAAYEYVLQKKEISKPKQSYSGGMSNKPPSFNTSSISETTASSPSQSTQPSAFTLKNKGKKLRKFAETSSSVCFILNRRKRREILGIFKGKTSLFNTKI